MDFTGPLFCLDFPKVKLYICLFSCAVVRAVHLALTDSLSSISFMLAFRRFVARRGMPSVLYSDNAQTFKGAEVQLQNQFGGCTPEWKYIVPKSPWWGGWWERLVRSVKSGLRRSVAKRCLTKVELETTLVEIESCVNSRPLTFVGDEVDVVNPLSPSHFLVGKRLELQPRAVEDPESVSRDLLVDRANVRNEMLDRFWHVWQQNYLRNLPASVAKFKSKGQLEVGSVVLVREDNMPRMKWELAVVKKLYTSVDGYVRSVLLLYSGCMT